MEQSAAIVLIDSVFYKDFASELLVLAWPHWGAGDGPGGERVATGIAWHVEASANVFVGVRRDGRPHAPATMCEAGIPSSTARLTASELKSPPERSAAQWVDIAKKLLSWWGVILCRDAEAGWQK